MVNRTNIVQLSWFARPILVERLWSGLNPANEEQVRSIMRSRHYDKGQVIFSSDVTPGEIVVLESGNAELATSKLDRHVRPAVTGEAFGITELLAGAPYSDSLKALSDCETAIISSIDLIWYLRHQPEACYHFLEILAENLHQAMQALGDKDQNL